MKSNLKLYRNEILIFYEFFLFFVFPLYIPNGYNNIGSDKYILFMTFSTPIILIVFLLSYSEVKPIFLKCIRNYKTILIFIFVLLTSMFFSIDIKSAFWGNAGWWMGFFTYFIYICLFFIFSNRTNWNYRYTFGIQYVGSLIVNIIAFLNSLHLYPIPGTGTVSYFMTTIGNVNWYGGYLILFLAFNIGIYIIAPHIKNQRDRRVLQVILPPYIIVGLFCLIISTNKSLFLSLGIILLLLLCFLCIYADCNYQFYKLLILIGISAETIALSFYHLNISDGCYESFMPMILIKKHIGLAFIFCGILPLVFYSRQKTKNGFIKKGTNMMHAAITKFMLSLLAVPILFLIVQLLPNIVFADDFGNGRGFLWSLAKDSFYHFSVMRKMIGIGPDCWSIYLYQKTNYIPLLEAYSNKEIVTNVHSELLNSLITWGILGVIAYINMLYTLMKKAFSDNFLSSFPFYLLLLALLFCNMVSFQQPINMPFLFFALAIMQQDMKNIFI